MSAAEEAIEVARAQEQLRQEIETFNQRKNQDRKWFFLQLTLGWIAAIILPGVGAICGWIIFNFADFTTTIVKLALGALAVDVVGVVVSVWRVVLAKSTQTLLPVTKASSISNNDQVEASEAATSEISSRDEASEAATSEISSRDEASEAATPPNRP
jgi:hypothetical protein